MTGPLDNDAILGQILGKLTTIQEDVRLTVLSLHGGRATDGEHVTGLLNEFSALQDRVAVLEAKANDNGQRTWAIVLAVVAAALGWLGSHFGK